MPPEERFKLKRPALLAAILAAVVPASVSAAAGRVDFAIGDVRAVGVDGKERPLTAGASITSGETIRTATGRAHVRFSDGAYVSLKPDTELRVDDYRFEGGEDASARGFFSLIKGGLRTITGLIGKRDRDAYQMRTAVATVGIRGTHYSVEVAGGRGGGNPTAHITNYRDSSTITVEYNPVLTLPAGISITVTEVGGVTLVEVENPSTRETGLYQIITTERPTGENVYEFVFLREGTDLLASGGPALAGEIGLGLADILRGAVRIGS